MSLILALKNGGAGGMIPSFVRSFSKKRGLPSMRTYLEVLARGDF